MIMMSFVESDVVLEECGCFMVLSEVVLDGPYLLFHDDDVVISVVELVVVIVGFRLLLGTPSTLINNVKLPVWPLLPIASKTTVILKSVCSPNSVKFAKGCRRLKLPFTNRILSLYFVGYTEICNVRIMIISH